jgi:hypothetical protein
VGQARRVVDAALVRQDVGSYRDAGTTGNREFLPRTVDVPEFTAGIQRHRAVLDRLYPETEWLGGTLWPVAGDLSFAAWRATPLRLTVSVENRGTGSGTLGVRQLLFTGWRAWLDGQPTGISPAPRSASQQASPGFMTVKIPTGRHEVTLAAGPSVPTIVGVSVSGVTLMLLGAAAMRSGAARRRRLVLHPVGVALLLAGAVIPVRMLAPVFHRFSAVGEQTPYTRQLLSNIAREARGGVAVVSSPSGARVAADAHVDVRFLTVPDWDDPARDSAGESRHEWLYMHPQSSVAVNVALPDAPGLAFQAALAVDPAVWEAPTGDGVRFIARVTPLGAAGSATETLLDTSLNPRARAEDRKWVAVAASLDRFRGQRIRLTLATEHREDATFDWAGWGDPVVIQADTARGPIGRDADVRVSLPPRGPQPDATARAKPAPRPTRS